jgi:hypothetical protein
VIGCDHYATAATIRSGLLVGMANPHPDLVERHGAPYTRN